LRQFFFKHKKLFFGALISSNNGTESSKLTLPVLVVISFCAKVVVAINNRVIEVTFHAKIRIEFNKLLRGRAREVLKKTQISQINTGFSVQIYEIGVKKSKQRFEELNLKILKLRRFLDYSM
jgi:hypothetical protein